MFKIAINAGHGLHTTGKRCDRRYDPAETREWTLNQCVAGYLQKGLKLYPDCKILRTDDTTGADDYQLQRRIKTAEGYSADVYISIHHEDRPIAGTAVYIKPGASDDALRLQAALCDKLGATAQTADYIECVTPAMPAVLIQCGSMCHAEDIARVLTDKYAHGVALGIMTALVEYAGLTPMAVDSADTPAPPPTVRKRKPKAEVSQ